VISGGARTLACLGLLPGINAQPAGAAGIRSAGEAMHGVAARHALRQEPSFISPPQQSSAATGVPMLSHGVAAGCAAHAVSTGPNASQNANSADMRMRDRAMTNRL